MIVEQLIAILGYDIQDAGKAKQWKDNIDALARSAEQAAIRIGNFATKAGAALAAAAGAMGASVIKTGALFEGLDVQLTALEGSAEKGKQSLDWIRQFAQETPLSLSETANAFVQLRNFGIDPTNGSLLAAVDSAALMGKGIDHVMGITLAMGQAWSRGKLQGNDILQLIDRGIPVWDLLADVMGKTVEEVQELSSKGKIGRHEMQLFFDAMGKRAAGASETMSKTWAGIMGRMGDVWEDFNKRIADAGSFADAKALLEDVMAVFTRWQKDGTMDKAAETFSRFMVRVMRGMKFFVDRVAANVRYLNENWASIEPHLNSLALVFAGLIAYAQPLLFFFMVLGLVIDDFLTYLRGGESLIGDFIEALKEWLGVSQGVAEWITGTFAAAGGLILLNFRGLTRGLLRLTLTLGVMLTRQFLRIGLRLGIALLGGLRGLLPAFFRSLGMELITGAGRAVPVLARALPSIISRAFAVVAIASVVNELVKRWFDVDLFDIGAKLITRLWEGMQSVFATLPDLVSDAVNGMFSPESAEKLQVKTDANKPFAEKLEGTIVDTLGEPETWLGGLGRWFVERQRAANGREASPAEMLLNLQTGGAKIDPANAAATVANTNTLNDSRDQSVVVNTTINQTVQQATQAPAAAAQATATAVSTAGRGSALPLPPARTIPGT